jgi:anti-anti-sigma regulatory factor
MKMTNLSPKVQELLETTRLNKVLEIYKDEDSALESFRPAVSGASG